VDEVNKEFTRDFSIPADVDQFSIKAQLDESTRILSLIGQMKGIEKENTTPVSSSSHENLKIGSIKENPSSSNLEYEIYLGNELKEGQISVEAAKGVINISVSKKNWDQFGDFSLELNRQIKLANPLVQRIEHGVDYRAGNLIIKIHI
jgi:HSP20 family molecular chaperone IbpA